MKKTEKILVNLYCGFTHSEHQIVLDKDCTVATFLEYLKQETEFFLNVYWEFFLRSCAIATDRYIVNLTPDSMKDQIYLKELGIKDGATIYVLPKGFYIVNGIPNWMKKYLKTLGIKELRIKNGATIYMLPQGIYL